MKAIVCKSYGPTSQLQLKEVEKPTPKSKEVLIKVHFSAVNDYDWSMVRGEPKLYRLLFGLFKPKHPIPGMELSGVVESCGEDVTKFNVGDAVYGDISAHGFGSFAEYIAIHENAIVRKPEYLPFEEAAALSHAANLAWQGLVDFGKIKNEMNVLINGAGGGVGSIGLQIAKAHNCQVTGVDTGDKLEAMKEAGFDHVIDYKKEDFTRSNDKYDLILDAKTTRAPKAYQKVLKPNGRYVTVGGKIGRLLQIAFTQNVMKKPVYVVPLDANKDLEQIHDLYQSGKIKSFIDGPYPLEKTGEAIQHFGEGQHHGKVIVSCSPR
ncbi:NADPH:quinone reductase [Ekhidna lutea]|uniref:NADPH:quinone reductase n=1 Tax=Ekhidna lutea TaxID=447679 RepID=A0A239JNH2_EKHLU|nr:NAD(P)-dependent alcohol dehydrogenase [Ekhidna lutea]SNT07387.1 NADPH:quinone reductase [Ekhidna lutea]